jgi:energy-coupling factor transporter ATP-binding protein EcfA2
VRNTSLYFQPQIRTKILNEGWASYWHEKLFLEERKIFDQQTGSGQAVIFDVRENFSDFMFINTFVDQDFVDAYKLFVSAKRLNQQKGVWEYTIKSRNASDAKQMLLDTLYHPPFIEIRTEKTNPDCLYLDHHFEDKPLVNAFIANTMLGISCLWGGTVKLETNELAAKSAGSQAPTSYQSLYGIQQNRIYIFEGPHGCGKSTFLNNLLMKFEQYTNSDAGAAYETVWRLNTKELGAFGEYEAEIILAQLQSLVDRKAARANEHDHSKILGFAKKDQLEIPCPSHDNPLLLIPKIYRRELLDNLIHDAEFKDRLFNEKQYEWVFKNNACTICTFLYQTFFHATLKPTTESMHWLMDVKAHNKERFANLHGIISEGVHKVEDIEENVNSLFLALMNPEDQDNITGTQSFSDRIIYIKIPYVLDYNTEAKIYKNVFGDRIENNFLPRVLQNFAKVIISSRLNIKSDGQRVCVYRRGAGHLRRLLHRYRDSAAELGFERSPTQGVSKGNAEAVRFQNADPGDSG